MGKWLWHSPVLRFAVLLNQDKYLEEVSEESQGSILYKGLPIALLLVKHSLLSEEDSPQMYW